MLALVVAGLLLLRWVPRHGGFPLGLTLLTAATALAITVGQARRYRRSARGIRDGRVEADVVGVVGTTVAVALLGALALVVVVALPLR